MGLRKHTEAQQPREAVAREYVRDADGLLAALRGGDATQRRWAARDLAAHPDRAAALGEHLLAEQDASVREALFTSLSGIGDVDAMAALLPLLRSPDAALRNGAIEALADMPDVVGPRIDALLADADAHVRIFTVNLLHDLCSPGVPGWLVRVLLNDPEVNVVGAAIEALAEAGSPEHVAALRAAERRFPDDAYIGFAVRVAVERIESA